MYASVDPSDQFSTRADSEIDLLADQHLEVVVAAPVLHEVYSLLLRRLGIAVSRRWLGEVLDGASVVIPQPHDYGAALHILQRIEDQPITLTDAVVAAMSRRLDLPVWTYDHHFDVMQVEVWRDA